ncbi:alpha/beta hydrolase [Tumebacillus flagellatus]|uniref:Esterase n=1 Tax=Tumebacillus flagellatus TaxID=1157490 RepID=A0A074LX63_9BACL|nr:alpha/beta hydrolase-fold protein [Tumebacillus flagellatus]KEO84633.1 esterase [Tumebacillus flagellatus]
MVEKFLVPIPAFQQERQIRVYLPKSYGQGDARYPVLYMHDGQNVFRDEDEIGGVSLGLEAYLDERAVDVIVVAVDQVPEQRIDEYYAWKHGAFSEQILGFHDERGGKGGAYIDFIAEELKPLIDRKYRTLPERTGMAGISSGASITVYAACRYPHIFRRIAGFSIAYYRNQEDMERFVREADLSLLEKVYLDCGTNEGKGDEEAGLQFLNSNRAVANILQEKVPHAEFRAVEGGEHQYSHFCKRAPEVLATLL